MEEFLCHETEFSLSSTISPSGWTFAQAMLEFITELLLWKSSSAVVEEIHVAQEMGQGVHGIRELSQECYFSSCHKFQSKNIDESQAHLWLGERRSDKSRYLHSNTTPICTDQDNLQGNHMALYGLIWLRFDFSILDRWAGTPELSWEYIDTCTWYCTAHKPFKVRVWFYAT